MEDMTERNMLKIMAHQKPSTTNPLTHEPAIRMMKALITSRKNPKVRMVNGIVRMTISGFRKRFKKLITRATSKAVQKELTWMPGNRYPASRMATDVRISFGRNGICMFFGMFYSNKGMEIELQMMQPEGCYEEMDYNGVMNDKMVACRNFII